MEYPDDMSPEHVEILRAMTPGQRLRAAQDLYDSAWNLKAAWLRSIHPEWTEDAIQRAVREAFMNARS